MITRTFRKVLLALQVPLLAVALQAAAAIPVIIDTDIGDDIDDTWALALALRSPELNVRMVVGDYGKPEYRARLIARLLQTAGRTDVAVGVGMESGKDQLERQGKWVEGYRLDSYPGKVHRDGIAAMVRMLSESKEKMTLIAIGPAPNLAEALRREPGLVRKVRFVGMYGSVRLGYGGTPPPAPEWNVKADVTAAQKVFSADWDMTITPLDTCGRVQLKGDKYKAVFSSDAPVVKALIENYRIWEQFNQTKGETNLVYSVRSSTLFDCVAVYLAITNDLCRMESLNLVVDKDGFTREDPRGKLMRVATDWKNLEGFEDWLARRLSGKQ